MDFLTFSVSVFLTLYLYFQLSSPSQARVWCTPTPPGSRLLTSRRRTLPTRDIEDLSLVQLTQSCALIGPEPFSVLKYFHPLRGPIIGALTLSVMKYLYQLYYFYTNIDIYLNLKVLLDIMMVVLPII